MLEGLGHDENKKILAGQHSLALLVHALEHRLACLGATGQQAPGQRALAAAFTHRHDACA